MSKNVRLFNYGCNEFFNRSLWFAPQQLQHIIQSMEIVMKYVPFFIFDVRTNTKYEAKIYHKCKSSTNQMVIESWTPVSGIRTGNTLEPDYFAIFSKHWQWSAHIGYHESLIACANNTLREAVKPMKSEWIPSKAIPTQIPIAPEIAINWEEAWVEDVCWFRRKHDSGGQWLTSLFLVGGLKTTAFRGDRRI